MPKSNPLSLAELNALLPRIQATMEALAGDGRRGRAAAPAANGRKHKGRRKANGRKAAGRKQGGGRNRAGAARLQEKLLATLKAGKGLQLRDIVKKVGGDSGPVQYHLRALRAQKKARVVGDRKEARWFAAK
jgi:hypothetical protein